MAIAMRKRVWRPLVRITALAAGVLALAGCATGYNMVQPSVAGSGAYYTSNGPYGDGGYYDDAVGSYYAGGGIGSPYYGFGSIGYGYPGFGSFAYGYPGFGSGPWLGASPWFGLGFGNACGWACAGFYGNPFYAGFGYPFGWGSVGYIGYRHHHDHGNRPGNGHAWNASHHDHNGWDHTAWNNRTWQHRNDWNTRRAPGAGAPGIEVAGEAAPADFAARRALPSAGFAPRPRAGASAFAARRAARISELVGPPAMAPGFRGRAAFSRPTEVPMLRSAAADDFPPSAAPMLRQAAPHDFPAAAPMLRPMAPRNFPAPAMRAAPVMRAMPAARGTPATHVR